MESQFEALEERHYVAINTDLSTANISQTTDTHFRNTSHRRLHVDLALTEDLGFPGCHVVGLGGDDLRRLSATLSNA